MLLKAMFNDPLGVAREMDRLFDSMASSQPPGFAPTIRSPWTYPAINLWEDEERIVAEAELPGVRMDDVEVLVTDEALTIRGVRSVDLPEGAQALRRERAVGSFERSVALPAPIDGDGVDAKLSNGVLRVTLPKAPAVKPRKVEIDTLPTSDREENES